MIKSADGEVRQLVAALGSDKPARVEAAMARLNIIGSRAVARLVDQYLQTQDRTHRLAILRVLESSGDERVLPVVRDGLSAGTDLALAAVGILRELLTRGTAAMQVTALDILLGVSNDLASERPVRAAAAEALTQAPVDVRTALERELGRAETTEHAVWEEAAEGRLADDPKLLANAVDVEAARAPLPVLQRMIEAIRAREQASASAARRHQWQDLRGAIHQALAARGSRIALYDLRETVEAAGEPLPADFLAALVRIGDASCLEALATALRRAPQREIRWRHDIGQAFAAIVRRERLSARHSAMRRALSKAPELRSA